MKKFYGDDINKIDIGNLLKATPYSIYTQLNFNKELSQDVFFNHLYVGRARNSDFEMDKENEKFDFLVDSSLNKIDNIFEKVNMIHIAGYGGCGKTTYVHRKLWKINSWRNMPYIVVDFENKGGIENSIIETIYNEIKKDISGSIIFLDDYVFQKSFLMGGFSKLVDGVREFVTQLKKDNNVIDINSIVRIVKSKLEVIYEYEMYIQCLILILFLLLLKNKVEDRTEGSFVLFFDNADSISDITQEVTLLNVLKDFVTNCNSFFGENIGSDAIYRGRKIKEIVYNTKFVFLLTTRIVTIKRYMSLKPDFDTIYGWISLEMPEHYYDHCEIIRNRVSYYSLMEAGERKSVVVLKLMEINKLSAALYQTQSYRKLFNGNLRFCVDTMISLYSMYGSSQLIEQTLQLREDANQITEAYYGANGMALSILLNYFKANGIYSEKLHLSECRRDSKISLSRIILTIIRERDNRCSVKTIADALRPFYEIDEIAEVIWDLCEAKRDCWRRLITFDVWFPKSKDDLINQIKRYVGEDIDDSIEEYSDIVLCTSGLAYIDYVIPHFEFMLSRNIGNTNFLYDNRYAPLFSADSEEKLQENGRCTYLFEKKIDTVFKDVKDCCYNSQVFARKVKEKFNLSSKDFLEKTFYNYHSNNSGYRQSYSARLIFGHIGYIEKYRRYLLKKNMYGSKEQLQKYNEGIVVRIKKYLELYKDEQYCIQTKGQSNVTENLLSRIKVIENANYLDFVTKIELD